MRDLQGVWPHVRPIAFESATLGKLRHICGNWIGIDGLLSQSRLEKGLMEDEDGSLRHS